MTIFFLINKKWDKKHNFEKTQQIKKCYLRKKNERIKKNILKSST